jgi:membrane glycosyltransferase
MSLYARIAAGLLIALAVAGLWWKVDRVLAAAEERGYERAMQEQTAKALAESQAKAREGFRRLEAQDANQRAQDAEVARMRADRDAAFAAADRVRQQSAEAARQWAGRLADSPTAQDLSAAGAAIQLLTDVRSRLERAGADLAAHADASRASGLKCERDYDSLTKASEKQ